MISAAEALLLPTAQLSEEEEAGAKKLMREIEAHVRASMEYRGVDFETSETRPNVLARCNQLLKRAGYVTEWRPRVKQSRLGQPTVDGFSLTLPPSDAAYAEALALALS